MYVWGTQRLSDFLEVFTELSKAVVLVLSVYYSESCRLKSVIEQVHRTECRRDKVRPSSCPLPAEGRGQCLALPTMTRGSQGAGSLANQGSSAVPCCPGLVV